MFNVKPCPKTPRKFLLNHLNGSFSRRPPPQNPHDRDYTRPPSCPALLLLGTTAASPLSGLNSLAVALGGALHTAHEASGSLEGPLQVTGSRLAKGVDLEEVVLEGTLERDNALDQQRVGVLEVEVHDAHHTHAHHLRSEELLELGGVVGVDGGGDELALLGGAHGSRLDVLEGGHVCGKGIVSNQVPSFSI